MSGPRPSPPLNEADAYNHPVLDIFVPHQGDSQGTATLLVEAASGLHGRHVRADNARGGYWISDALADIVYDVPDEDEPEPEPEPTPETPDEAPAKTGRTTKNKSQKGSTK